MELSRRYFSHFSRISKGVPVSIIQLDICFSSRSFSKRKKEDGPTRLALHSITIVLSLYPVSREVEKKC